MSEIKVKGSLAKEAALKLSLTETKEKDGALHAIARSLVKHSDEILRANGIDIVEAKEKGINGALLDRLTLTPKRILDMAEGLSQIAKLNDPVGEVLEVIERPNGLNIRKVRVPLGVIGIIYEARPNVTVDAAGLCLKAGNAVILRGGSEALHTNKSLIR
ncbi:MAG: gamma-glutamyl-phosphate reductase, partial [Erysipelotrichaceae bacterium]|nr:gamma-glutamyl-phosphate reductase [Erysipelotrichaceae bacterium]